MVDYKHIVQQIEQFQTICCDLTTEGIYLCNNFIVNYLIEKLRVSSVNFRTYLRCIQVRLTFLDDILSRVKFEDLNKNLMELTVFHSTWEVKRKHKHTVKKDGCY